VASELEKRVLTEKAKGLSDLEIASKLMLSEWVVRSIARKRGRGISDGGGEGDAPPEQFSRGESARDEGEPRDYERIDPSNARVVPPPQEGQR
jgi:hypothetical protein